MKLLGKGSKPNYNESATLASPSTNAVSFREELKAGRGQP